MLALAGAGSAATPAAPEDVDLRPLIRRLLPTLRASRLPVVLPSGLAVGYVGERLYARATALPGHFTLVVEGAPNCHGATACFIASFEARRGAALPRTPNVTLRGGVQAVVMRSRCGASCGPASLSFRQRDVLYTWQVRGLLGDERETLRTTGGRALAVGAR